MFDAMEPQTALGMDGGPLLVSRFACDSDFGVNPDDRRISRVRKDGASA
jgi:hypothetical protein